MVIWLRNCGSDKGSKWCVGMAVKSHKMYLTHIKAQEKSMDLLSTSTQCTNLACGCAHWSVFVCGGRGFDLDYRASGALSTLVTLESKVKVLKRKVKTCSCCTTNDDY
eukprot:scaffold47545_cov73-Cyclotella_meneghiniana.AAC.2